MGAATTIAIQGNINSSIAMAEAASARRAACSALITQYEAKTATVSQMQEYAHCVETLFPKHLDGTELIAAKALFVLALLGAVIGVVKAFREPWNTFMDWVMYGLAGAFFVPAAAAILAGAGLGLVWLFQ